MCKNGLNILLEIARAYFEWMCKSGGLDVFSFALITPCITSSNLITENYLPRFSR